VNDRLTTCLRVTVGANHTYCRVITTNADGYDDSGLGYPMTLVNCTKPILTNIQRESSILYWLMLTINLMFIGYYDDGSVAKVKDISLTFSNYCQLDAFADDSSFNII
jgi:hypothetical protein